MYVTKKLPMYFYSQGQLKITSRGWGGALGSFNLFSASHAVGYIQGLAD